MNSKMTTNSQLSTTEPNKDKNKNKLSKQLEQEQNQSPQKWRSHGGLLVGWGAGGRQGTGNKKHKW